MDSGKPEVYKSIIRDEWCMACRECKVIDYYPSWLMAYQSAVMHSELSVKHWVPESKTSYGTLLTMASILDGWRTELATIPVFTSPS